MIGRLFFYALLLNAGAISSGYAIAPVVDDSEHYYKYEPAPETGLSAHHAEREDDETPIAKSIPREASHTESLQAQVKQLQQEVQSLRGDLEVQTHALSQLKQQQHSFYQDIDARFNKLPSPSKAHPPTLKAPPAVSESPQPVPTAPGPALSKNMDLTLIDPHPVATATPENPADEQIAYLAAYNLIKTKQYAAARTAMTNLTARYPKGSYTANAEYWLGELSLADHQPTEALKHFETVLKQFPASSKAAACALKIGYALSDLGQRQDAKKRLEQVLKNYPDTTAAQLARTKLNTL